MGVRTLHRHHVVEYLCITSTLLIRLNTEIGNTWFEQLFNTDFIIIIITFEDSKPQTVYGLFAAKNYHTNEILQYIISMELLIIE